MRRFVGGILVALLFTGLMPQPAAAAPWVNGDLFFGVPGGLYQVWSPNGTKLETIEQQVGGVPLSGNAAGCVLNNGKLYTTNWSSGDVVVFDGNDPHSVLQTIDTTSVVTATESVLFDPDGNLLVGTIRGAANPVLKYTPAGTLLDSYPVQIENSGSDWIDLSTDGHTLFYTSEGTHIFKYNLTTKVQKADFVALSPSSPPLYALRLLPPGDGTAGLLAANSYDIKRFDGQGNVVQTYDAAGEDFWFSINLDPDGTSFWAGDLFNGHVYRFNIATGSVLAGPFDAGVSSYDLDGICVKGEPLLGGSADLVITKSDAPDPVTVGSDLVYTLQVHNNGPDSASSVSASDVLPAGVSFKSATTGCSNASGTVTCSFGTMANGATSSKTITVTPTTANASLSNTATVSSSTADPASTNNHSTTTTQVLLRTSDVSITMDSTSYIFPGKTSVNVGLHGLNAGPDEAGGVVLTAQIPPGTGFASASNGGVYDAGAQTVTWSLGAVGAAITFEEVLHLSVPEDRLAPITTTASVTSTSIDPDPSNNEASATSRTAPRDIAFVSTRSGNPDIWVMYQDGTGVAQLTQAPGCDLEPAWSPSGLKIAFATNRNDATPGTCSATDNFEVYTVNFDGTGLKRLTTNTAVDRQPTWNPGETKIAFSSDRGASHDFKVWTTRSSDGGALFQVTSAVCNEGTTGCMPDWSPPLGSAGTKIAFVRRCGTIAGCPRDSEIFTIQPDGTQVRQLTNNAVSDVAPDWGRPITGATVLPIVFSRFDGHDFEIYGMNSDGTMPFKITNNDGHDGDPSFAYSTCLIFDTDRIGNYEIFRTQDAVNSEPAAQVTNDTARDTDPSWSWLRLPYNLSFCG